MKLTVERTSLLVAICLYFSTALQVSVGQRSITTNLQPLTTRIYHVMVIVNGGFSKKYFLLLFTRNSFEQS